MKITWAYWQENKNSSSFLIVDLFSSVTVKIKLMINKFSSKIDSILWLK